MATRKQAVPEIEFSATESAGILAAEVIDSQPGVVRGWKMARDEELRTVRKAHNEARIKAGTARLLADLQA